MLVPFFMLICVRVARATLGQTKFSEGTLMYSQETQSSQRFLNLPESETSSTVPIRCEQTAPKSLSSESPLTKL